MLLRNALMTAGIVLLPASALAEAPQGKPPVEMNIRALPSIGHVVAEGAVQEIDDERHFVLVDESGSIEVRIDESESKALKAGDRVRVTGSLDTSLLGNKFINATSVEAHEGFGEMDKHKDMQGSAPAR